MKNSVYSILIKQKQNRRQTEKTHLCVHIFVYSSMTVKKTVHIGYNMCVGLE